MAEYRGIPIVAASGVHEAAFDLLRRFVPPGSRIADLGAGAGAFTQRVIDHGYLVDAVDIKRDHFRPASDFYALDLNETFSAALPGPYDAVSAIEILEHLENPRHFLRECAKLLRPSGVLLLTTPNIDSSHSRLTFLVRGEFQWFSDVFYESTGHITPITLWQLRLMAREARFGHVASGKGPKPVGVSRTRRILASLLRPVMRHASDDDIRIELFRKQ